MSKPLEHAQNNVKKYGGVVEDYLPIHEFIDSSKAGLGDKRHRAATHNSWFIYTVLPRVFGSVLTNKDGTAISVTQIGEDHVVEDYGQYGESFVPTLADFLSLLPLESWMDNGNGLPPSREKIREFSKKGIRLDDVVLDGASRFRPEYQKVEVEDDVIGPVKKLMKNPIVDYKAIAID